MLPWDWDHTAERQLILGRKGICYRDVGGGAFLKVLHLINSLSEGGAENLLKDLLPAMKGGGVDPEVLLLTEREDLYGDCLKRAGIPVFSTGVDNVYSPRQVFKVFSFLEGYDLVHVHLFPAQYWFALAKKLTGISVPALTTEHSTHNRRRNLLFFKPIDKLIYQQYAKIICVSDDVRNNLCRWVPAIAERTVTIYNGVDIVRYFLAKPYGREQLIPGLDQDDKLILMAARLSPAKDQETLIRAISLLPANYHLLLAGDGERKDALIQFVRRAGVMERVHFLGFRGDLDRIMKSVHLFVISSHWEGFGLAAVEAMACGLPVLASDVPGLARTLGGAGILFSEGDHQTLAREIERILTDTEFYIEKQQASLSRSEDFTLGKMVQDYLRVYHELLKETSFSGR
jgi:glycosyltransferase involved in cell wall biosynthesis